MKTNKIKELEDYLFNNSKRIEKEVYIELRKMVNSLKNDFISMPCPDCGNELYVSFKHGFGKCFSCGKIYKLEDND